jgi:hypothetical protein
VLHDDRQPERPDAHQRLADPQQRRHQRRHQRRVDEGQRHDPQKQISFETGPFADFDYWNISFQIGGAAYDTPYNDRCNIAYEDAGQLIQCIVGKHAPWGGDYNLQTKMPKSSSCDFNINKK